ncbi:hypothetical protein P4475_12005 [Halalkalibacterium halodurans]|nr:hypothetical protein [Halalkalibacterium halodurans]
MFFGSFERQAATPAGKVTAKDRREWGSRGSWSLPEESVRQVVILNE